jgi:enoyl-[acyl-carrier protein] reductase I
VSGTWPPALNIFLNLLERGKNELNPAVCRRGQLLEFEKIYPLDAVYDTYEAMPEEVRTSKRYKEVGDWLHQRGRTTAGERFRRTFRSTILVHSLAKTGRRSRNRCSRRVAMAILAAVAPARTRWCRWCSASVR